MAESEQGRSGGSVAPSKTVLDLGVSGSVSLGLVTLACEWATVTDLSDLYSWASSAMLPITPDGRDFARPSSLCKVRDRLL